MANVTLPFPLKGKDESLAVSGQPSLTSSSLLNVRAYDVQDDRARGGQRPALVKRYSQQIGGAAVKLDAICQITTIN